MEAVGAQRSRGRAGWGCRRVRAVGAEGFGLVGGGFGHALEACLYFLDVGGGGRIGGLYKNFFYSSEWRQYRGRAGWGR